MHQPPQLAGPDRARGRVAGPAPAVHLRAARARHVGRRAQRPDHLDAARRALQAEGRGGHPGRHAPRGTAVLRRGDLLVVAGEGRLSDEENRILPLESGVAHFAMLAACPGRAAARSSARAGCTSAARSAFASAAHPRGGVAAGARARASSPTASRPAEKNT